MINFLGELSFHHEVINVLGWAGVVLVNQVERVPLLILMFVDITALAE